MDIVKANEWPKSTELKAETEVLMIVTLDQSLPNRNDQAYIIKAVALKLIYMPCKQNPESINHFVSSCPILIPI